MVVPIQTHDSVRLKPSSSFKSTLIRYTARQHTPPEPVRGRASSIAAGRPYPLRGLRSSAADCSDRRMGPTSGWAHVQ